MRFGVCVWLGAQNEKSGDGNSSEIPRKQRQDGPFPPCFSQIEKLRTEDLFHLHRTQPSGLQMLLKALPVYFSSRFPPNRSPGFFFKPSWLLLEFCQVSINFSNCGECIPAGESERALSR